MALQRCAGTHRRVSPLQHEEVRAVARNAQAAVSIKVAADKLGQEGGGGGGRMAVEEYLNGIGVDLENRECARVEEGRENKETDCAVVIDG